MTSEVRRRPRRRKILAALLTLIGVLSVLTGCSAVTIWNYGNETSSASAEAVIILSAAIWKNEPSPIFRERLNHGIDLYRTGRVKKVLLTGGGRDGGLTEAEVGKAYAIRQGVPAVDIVMETSSTTTIENLRYARQVAQQNNLHTFLLVSDPLHMKRAMTIAKDMGLSVEPSPTPTTCFRTLGSRLGMLGRETRLYMAYRMGLGW